ncbi:hypothetical protein ACEN9H_31550 [Massilia cellulosiltytica]|jgi:hypothetical protein|uniref:hypothetical protein n=1 Tax=Massilia cellulosiltytica TaxID=2683234 RepID=UPI0039B3CFAE
MEDANKIEQAIDGVAEGIVQPSELQKLLKVEHRPAVLRNVAAELYRMQAIYNGAPDDHPYKKQAHERMPGLMRVISALGGNTIPVDTDNALLARYWVLDASGATIPDNVVIDWQS